jgi:hypothetical protein
LRSELAETPVVPTPPDQIMGDPGRRRPGPMPPAEPVLVSSHVILLTPRVF